MKILHFDLIAYGPFSGKSLPLSGGTEGLHIIYGPNEAGKSCALRGLISLFYGIPFQTKDNFVHENKNLKLGARIRNKAREELAFFRRKGKKDILLDERGLPLPDSVLQRYLSGVTEEIFRQMFGLDHQRLIDGGRQLVIGGGRVGESLFSAGTGIANLHHVMGTLRSEAEKLFKPTGQNPALNRLISEFKETKKKSNAHILSGRQWEIHDKALRSARIKEQNEKTGLNSLRREQVGLMRMREALPLIKERQENLIRLDHMKEVILLPLNFPEERRKAKETLDKAKISQKRAMDALEKLEEEITGLSIPEALIDQEEGITEIHGRRGSHLKAQSDLPKLQGEWESLQREGKAILLELRPDLDINSAGALRFTVQKRTRLEEIGKKLDKLQNERERNLTALQEIERDLTFARKALGKEVLLQDTGKLKAEVNRAQREVYREGDRKNLLSGMQKIQRQVQIDLKALPLWTGTLEELESLPVPSIEAIDLFSTRFHDSDTQLHNLSERIKEEQDKVDELLKKIHALTIEGSVPTEQELIEARQKRSRGWDLIIKDWLKKEDISQEALAFSKDIPLHKAYERAVNKTDEVADRLRREADRVAELANLMARKEQGQKIVEGFIKEHDCTLNTRKEIDEQWNALWREIGIEAQSPVEMKAWCKKQESLCTKAKELRETAGTVELMEKIITEHITTLSKCLKGYMDKGTEPPQTLSSLIEQSQIIINTVEKAAEKRRAGEKEVNRLEKEHLKKIADKKHLEDDLAELKKSWIQEVRELGLDDDVTPSQAAAFIARAKDLFITLDKAQSLQIRISGIQRDAKLFTEDVKALAATVAPDLITMPPHHIAAELNNRLKKAREDAVHLKQLKKQAAEKKGILEESQNTVREMLLTIDNLCKRAGCSIYEELEEIEMQSGRKRTLQEHLDHLDRELGRIAHNGGLTMKELIAEAEKYDPDDLPLQIEDLNRQISQKEEELAEINKIIGREENELEGMDGGSGGAETTEEMQGILAQIKDKAERYLHLITASVILNREIERYRQKNQGPVLERANTLFSELTLGSFAGLKTSYDDHDNPVLLGVRPSGQEITMEGMSEGTCDQLYLSLRLAGLEKHLHEAEPMPFIIDDILINFDDDRALATLKVLADLSRKTQIIFFTHHSHILDLAQKMASEKMINAQSLQVHYL